MVLLFSSHAFASTRALAKSGVLATGYKFVSLTNSLHVLGRLMTPAAAAS